jgi:hypothetical protein
MVGVIVCVNLLRVWNFTNFRNFTPQGTSSIISGAGTRWGSDKINMAYEPLYERFEVLESGGTRLGVKFIRSGFLTQGDRPELFFFDINGEEAVVGISGASLARFEHGRHRLSREQKIDLAGRWLKRQMEAGRPLNSESLYIQDNELANLAIELNFTQ